MAFVRITCCLKTPFAGTEAPYLDSLCELVMASKAKSIQESSGGCRHAYPIMKRGQPIDISAVGKLPIPIARTRISGLPIPHCSSPILSSTASDYAVYYTSAFPLGRQLHLRDDAMAKYQTTGGRFKSFRLPLRMRLVDRVVWFASLNNRPSRLRQILKQVLHLGKKVSQGHGLIANWDVKIIDQDWSWYADSPNGVVLMRPLPRDMNHPKNLIGYRESFGGCVGPYWQRDFWREIVEPC